MRVIGVDPGLSRLGLGLVDSRDGKTAVLEEETISTSPSLPAGERLAHLHKELSSAIDRWRPDAMALERVFLKSNAASAVSAIQAWGVSLLAASACGVEAHEYSPAEVKMAVVGSGAASKEQVRFMVSKIVGEPDPKWTIDGCDALAVAICHIHSSRMRALGRRPA